MDDKFFQQKDGMAVGSSLSAIINNIYMEHFERLALASALWPLYLDKNLASWPRAVTEFSQPSQ
jgi:hypothetical protein